ncbi:Mitochondrial phosphate carrier protein 1 [Nymphaea thermarum]|nr:Mitochondrial phosphate carrier protein 1 [Nymphaea thermarum]
MATTMGMAEEYDGRCKEGLRLFSPGYYGVCAIGGMLSAGATHLAITPLDVLKVNMQVNPAKYNSIFSGFSVLWKEQGIVGLWRGWAGKLYGYGAQGGCKFGLYEYFKKTYSDAFGPNVAGRQRTWIYFLSSASAQVIADVALCPFEAVKVRVQTQPNYAKGLIDGFPKLYAAEGLPGFYRGLAPLWARNLPFSILMFSTFEHTVDLLYHNVIQRKKEDCSRVQQLAITCTAGYVAGSVGTVVSNPADNVVASLYNKKAENVFQAVKNIGLVNLFTRSLPIRAAIVGPVITMQWCLYDTIKLLTGLPTSGGVGYVVETEHIS